MNKYLSNVILGFVQGMTEFLPVSSSGHLLLLEKLGVGEPDLATNLLLHLSTLLVVSVSFRKQIKHLICHPTSFPAKFILLATVPTAVCAGIIRYLLPDTAFYLPTAFFCTGILLLLPSFLPHSSTRLQEKGGRKALFVGLMQGLACFSGISRSGTTTTALVLAGCPKEECAEYSFLLSIPIIVGSSVVEILTAENVGSIDLSILPGFAVAAVSGFLSLRLFSGFLKKGRLSCFSVYAFGMSILSFCLLFR